jgi:hypothetical protein
MTIKENMMMEPKSFLKFKKIIFINNVKQLKKYCHGISVNLVPPLLSTTLYMYFVKNRTP